MELKQFRSVIAIIALLATAMQTSAMYYTSTPSNRIGKVIIVSGAEANGMIREHSDVVFMCQTEAHPLSNATFKWYLNDGSIPDVQQSIYFLMDVTREYHESTIRCSAKNSGGEFEGSLKLNVTYGPRFRSDSYTVESDLGDKVSLICDAEGNPPPEYLWLLKKTEKIVGTNGKLSVIVDMNSDGAYICEASVPGFPQIYSVYKIVIRKRMEKIQTNITILISSNIVIGILFVIIVILAAAIYHRAKNILTNL